MVWASNPHKGERFSLLYTIQISSAANPAPIQWAPCFFTGAKKAEA
jgi:hypothetical protein